MTTATERKRAQRAELARRGLGQYTVTWPVELIEELRDMEQTILIRHERELVMGEDAHRVAPARGGQ
jgi:hypothetical protein